MSSPLAPSTKRLYQRTLRRAYGELEPNFVPNIRDWPETQRAILRSAIRHHHSKRDKAYGDRLASEIETIRHTRKLRSYPTVEEQRRFEHAMRELPKRISAVIQLMLSTGMRTEETLTMPRTVLEDALRYNKLEVHGKGDVLREVDLPPKGRKAVERMLALDGPLPRRTEERREYDFVPQPWEKVGQLVSGAHSSYGTQRNRLFNQIKATAERAGLDLKQWSPHVLRHAYATRLIENGAPLPIVKAALGHRFLSTTERYMHPAATDLGRWAKGM